MNTGEIIKYFRLARNMTQEQLAQDAEISFSTLRKYEANERNPKYEQLSKIADALGISVHLFMDFDIQSVSDLFSILFKMEGQTDLEIATSKDLANLSEDSDKPALSLSFADQTWFELSSDCSDEEKEQMIKAAAFIKSCLRHSDK